MSALAGRRILVVEDEAIIAFAVEDLLIDLGCVVVGPAGTVEQAEQLAAAAEIDAAILDINLNGARSYVVAAALERRSIPFIFASGYDEEALQWASPVPLLAKPYRKEQIERALLEVLG